MKFLSYGIIFVMTFGNCGTILAAEADKSIESANSSNSEASKTPQASLQRLIEGNKRFLDDKTTCPDRNQMRRLSTAAQQKPFAIILGCSDSRIPPEIAFDQGIGDIFVVRVAGNIVSAVELDSIEYSAIHNGSSIIMVLGHQNCGAVEAVIAKKTKDIETIADLIKPALTKLKQSSPVNLVDAIEANVNNSVARIKESEVIQKLIKAGKIDVVPAYYDFTTGAVRILENKS